MATALNMTMKLKQDADSQQRLANLKGAFAGTVQPLIDQALAESEIVHYARVLVIDDQYIQIITEFDGKPEDYTEFFRMKLPGVFREIFTLADGVPSWEELNDRDTFFRVSSGKNLAALGEAAAGSARQGYLFSAYGNRTVKEIKRALANGNE